MPGLGPVTVIMVLEYVVVELTALPLRVAPLGSTSVMVAELDAVHTSRQVNWAMCESTGML